LETAAGEMRESLAYLQRALEEAEGQSAASARPIAGMNMTKRGQVLRMYRRGEQPEQIAAALTLPLNEVELLLKVHRSVISQF
jgi:DNA-binding NarL/FixJ family response regulator